MADPISLSLAGIAMLDPAYNRIWAIWAGCRAIAKFGVDFNRFATRVRIQERLFEASVLKYKVHIEADKIETRWIDSDLRKRIEDHTFEIVTVFEECYKLVESYKSEIIHVPAPAPAPAPVPVPIPGPAQAQAPANVPVANPGGQIAVVGAGGGPQRQSRFRRFFPGKKSSKGKAPEDPISLGSARPANLDQLTSRGREEGPSQWTSASVEARTNKRREEARRALAPIKAVQFAAGDQEQMETLLDRLNGMNKELNDCLPQLKNENPLLYIRNRADPPTIWRDTKAVRKDLNSLQEALTNANAEDEESGVKLAVRLEDNHSNLLDWMKYNRLNQKLKTRSDPNFFLLMALSQSETPDHIPCHELLVAGTLSDSRPGLEVSDGDMPSKLHTILSTAPEGKFQEIGDVKLDKDRIFHLRRIVETDRPKWKGDQTLGDILEKDFNEFSVTARICLAATLALAYIHFETANPGFTQRRVQHYRFFSQNTELGKDDWIQPWLDNGFSSASPPDAGGSLKSQKEIEQNKVNLAQELGILLYQITCRDRIAYEDTPAGLGQASKSVSTLEFLDRVRDLCGLSAKNIVKACFCHLPRKAGQREPASLIVEEVAYALQRLANEYRKQEDAEAAMEARLSGETLAAEPVNEQGVESQQPEQEHLAQQQAPAQQEDSMAPELPAAQGISTTGDIPAAQEAPAKQEATTPPRRQQDAIPMRTLRPLPQPVLAEAPTPQLETTPDSPSPVHVPRQPQQAAPKPGKQNPQPSAVNHTKPVVFPTVPEHAPQASVTNGAPMEQQKIPVAS